MVSIREKWQKMPVTLKASSVYAASSILQRCISFITMPVFSNILTTEQMGEVTIYNTWMGLITIFITLNLYAGSFQTAMVKFESRRDEYISSVQGIALYLTAIFLAIYIPFRHTFNIAFDLPTGIVLLMIANIFTDFTWSLWSGKQRFEFKYKAVALVSLANTFLSIVIAFVIVLNTEEKGFGRIIGFAAFTIIAGTAFFILNQARGKKLFNKEFWEYALRFNIPLIAYYLSQTIFNQSDKLMIEHIIDKSAAGIYGIAYTVAMVLTFVLNAINNSYIPWFYNQLKEDKHDDNRRVTVAITILMALLLCGVIWFAPEIIRIFGEEYLAATYVVLPVALSLLLLFFSQLFINVEFFYEKKKELVWASFGSAIVNIVLNWLLIPHFGIVAAGYTTLASYILFAFCNYLAMRKILKEQNKKDNMFNYKLLVIIFLLLCVISAVGALLYGILIARIAVAVAVLTVMVIKRNYFIDMYKQIKGKK